MAFPFVVSQCSFDRHCERSEAIQSFDEKKDWIASSLRSSQ
jgi:hypothetical protein